MNNKVMLIVAVVAGILATVLAFLYINTASGAMKTPEREPTVEIIWVKRDLPANRALVPDEDLTVERIGARTSSGLVTASYKADELDALSGQRINTALSAGQPLLYAHLQQYKNVDLPLSSRAISLQLSTANMIGGLLIPGDRVDIIASYRQLVEEEAPAETDPDIDLGNPQAAVGAVLGKLIAQQTGNAGVLVVEPVLTNVRVIAINEHLSISRQAHMYGFESLSTGVAGAANNIVSFEVTPEQAQQLIKVQRYNSVQLTLLLRPPSNTRETTPVAEEG